MRNALIINPWINDFKLYDEWMHPLGLYFLISHLDSLGWNIDYLNLLTRSKKQKSKRYSTGFFEAEEIAKPTIYDNIPRAYKRYGMSVSSLNEKLKSINKPDVIFVGSGMTFWFGGLADTIAELKKFYPNVPIVIGGLSARLIPNVLRNNFKDVIIYSGRLQDSISDLKEVSELLNDIDSIAPPQSFVTALNYNKSMLHAPILASFGCPMRCTYCSSGYLEPKFILRNNLDVLNEILVAKDKFGVNDFALYDDAFLFKSDNLAVPFLQNIIKYNLNLRLHAPNGLHAKWLTQEISDLLFKAGFVTIRLGYECGSAKYKKDTNEKTNRVEIKKTVSILKNSGFANKDIGIYVMSGLVGQTPQETIEEIEFLMTLGVSIKPVFLSPVPGSRLFSVYSKEVPELLTNPLLHNDLFFITKLPGWSWDAVNTVKNSVRA